MRLEHLPSKFRAAAAARPAAQDLGPQTLREIEMQAIYQTLERLDGNKPKAAEELGISLKTLYNKLNQSNALDKVGLKRQRLEECAWHGGCKMLAERAA